MRVSPSRGRHRDRIAPWGASWGGGPRNRRTAFFALRGGRNTLLSNRKSFQMRFPRPERNLVSLVAAATPVSTLLHTPAVEETHGEGSGTRAGQFALFAGCVCPSRAVSHHHNCHDDVRLLHLSNVWRRQPVIRVAGAAVMMTRGHHRPRPIRQKKSVQLQGGEMPPCEYRAGVGRWGRSGGYLWVRHGRSSRTTSDGDVTGVYSVPPLPPSTSSQLTPR